MLCVVIHLPMELLGNTLIQCIVQIEICTEIIPKSGDIMIKK
jgi:hypothetical protein